PRPTVCTCWVSCGCSGALLDLHSFPTRRSSDLGAGRTCVTGGSGVAALTGSAGAAALREQSPISGADERIVTDVAAGQRHVARAGTESAFLDASRVASPPASRDLVGNVASRNRA